MSKPTEDEMTFGSGKWVYCRQHMRAHTTGWCTVHSDQKTKLLADNIEDATAECRARGFALFGDDPPVIWARPTSN